MAQYYRVSCNKYYGNEYANDGSGKIKRDGEEFQGTLGSTPYLKKETYRYSYKSIREGIEHICERFGWQYPDNGHIDVRRATKGMDAHIILTFTVTRDLKEAYQNERNLFNEGKIKLYRLTVYLFFEQVVVREATVEELEEAYTSLAAQYVD